LPASLVEAIRYSLLSGGKRIRPVLAWHACAACGTSGEASLPAGGAIELVHAFSLVHDDLPAMDDDDLRRGKPTLHIHAGEAMAILAGDAMLALAFGTLSEQANPASLGPILTRELADATAAMIAGQVYDTLGGLPQGLPARAQLETIHRNKTGALLRASCRMGAMCGLAARGLDPAQIAASAELAALTRFGEVIGLMFQIVDDLLDATGTSEQTGKRTRKDADAGKLTYPGVLGVEGSRVEVTLLLAEAEQSLQPLGPRAGVLLELAQFVASRRA